MPSSSWATRPFVIVLSSYNFNFVGRVGIEPTLEQINSLCEWLNNMLTNNPNFWRATKTNISTSPYVFVGLERLELSKHMHLKHARLPFAAQTHIVVLKEGFEPTHFRFWDEVVYQLRHFSIWRIDGTWTHVSWSDSNLTYALANILFSLYRRVDLNHRPRGYESLATTTVLRRYVSIRWESNPQDSVSKTNMSSSCITNRSFAVIEGIEPSPHDRQSRILTIGPYHRMYLLWSHWESNPEPVIKSHLVYR